MFPFSKFKSFFDKRKTRRVQPTNTIQTPDQRKHDELLQELREKTIILNTSKEEQKKARRLPNTFLPIPEIVARRMSPDFDAEMDSDDEKRLNQNLGSGYFGSGY